MDESTIATLAESVRARARKMSDFAARLSAIHAAITDPDANTFRAELREHVRRCRTAAGDLSAAASRLDEHARAVRTRTARA